MHMFLFLLLLLLHINTQTTNLSQFHTRRHTQKDLRIKVTQFSVGVVVVFCFIRPSFTVSFFSQENSGDQSIINLSLRSKLKQLRFIGRMVGFAVCQDLLVNLQLSKPFVKQV